MSPVLSWDKQKPAFAKMKTPPALKDPLDKIKSAYDATEWSAFGTDKLDTPEAAVKRLADLERQAKASLKVLTDKAVEAEKVAKKAWDDLKKDKSAPPDAVKALEAMTKAAGQLQSDVGDFIEKARNAIQGELDKLTKAAANKKAAPAAGAKPPLTKESKFIRGKIIECFRKIKTPVPGARPWRFLVVKGTATVGVCFLQTVPGNAQANMLKKMMPGEKVQILKDPKGEVIWENKSVTLVTVQPMSGVAKKVQLWLKKLTGINVKIRVRKPTGEMLEEGDEGDDLPDELLKADPAEVAEKARAGKEFETRLRALKDKLQKGLQSATPENKAEIKALVDSITANGKAQKFEDANDDLDSLEALLEEEGSAGTAPADGADLQQLRQARTDWANSRKEAVAQINELAKAIQREFAAEAAQKAQVDKAVSQFTMLTGMLKTDLETLLDKALNEKDPAARAQQAAQARRLSQQIRELLDRHPVMREIDDNEIMPIKVVEPMKQSLSAVEAALG
jgi:hypothetical protein